MCVFAVSIRSCANRTAKLGLFFCSILLGLAPPPALAQFIKEIDEHGNVTYRDDPSYDYTMDQPSPENQQINAEQIKRLREFLKHRDKRPAPEPRTPNTTVRTGRSVCLRRPSIANSRLGCP